jgi:hypothetical protein
MQSLKPWGATWVVVCALSVLGSGCSAPADEAEPGQAQPDPFAPWLDMGQDGADDSDMGTEVDPEPVEDAGALPDLSGLPNLTEDAGPEQPEDLAEDAPEPDAVEADVVEEDAGEPDVTEPDPVEVCAVEATPMRRLSHFEYRNTLRDLFPEIPLPSMELPDDNRPHEFDNDANAMLPSAALLEGYTKIARDIVEALGQDILALSPCQMEQETPEEVDRCGRQFVLTQGQRLFRRPLDEAQVEAYTALMRADIEGATYLHRLQLTLQLMLTAPEFLYRMERPVGEVEPGQQAQLDGWSRASRLSYFLWGTTPDDELMAAAADGSLMTPEGMQLHAERLANDPRAREVFSHFHAQWLDYDRIHHVTKREDDAFTPELRQAMYEQAEIFVDQVLFDEDGGLAELLTSDTTYVNAELARLYGLEPPAEGWEQVAGPQRSGLLTQPLFLASRAHPDKPSPVLRGTFVLERVLCIDFGPPPANAEAAAASAEDLLEGPLTNRQTYELITSDSQCSSCHNMINPIGAAFENYDTMGRYRTHEPNGLAIDSSASTLGLDYQDASGLMAQLSTSEMVERCVVSKWVRYAYSGGPAEGSACLIDELRQEQRAKGGSFRDLQISIATHGWFGTYQAPEP